MASGSETPASSSERPSHSSTLISENATAVGTSAIKRLALDSEDVTFSGAPVERINPLGTNVTFWSAVFLPLSRLLGMGVYSTPGVVVECTGSIGFAFILWSIGALVAFSGLSIYIELASRFPNRSGGDVVFLEQAYTKPPYLVSTVFAVSYVMLSMTAINATIFSQYAMHALGLEVTAFRQKGLAVTMITCSLALCLFSTRTSLKTMRALGFIKVGSMIFMILTGFSVLLGMTRINSPWENLRHPFAGSVFTANGLATGIIKVDYTFAGWNHAVTFLSEIQSKYTSHVEESGQDGSTRGADLNPVKLLRKASFVALFVAAFIFLFLNIAYFAAIPKDTLEQSGSLVGAMFCESVYGKDSFVAKRLFPTLIALSCVGGLIATTLGHARIVREAARQGVLPYPEVLSSPWPFGTPTVPILIQWTTSVLVVVIPPAGDAFNFLINLNTYPNLVFASLVALATWILRARVPSVNEFRTWNVFVFIYLAKCILTLVMPWIPPKSQTGTNSGLWYATYCVVSLAILGVSVGYYYAWMVVLPHFGGYEIVQETVALDGGALTNRFVKVKTTEQKAGDADQLAPLLNNTTDL